MSIASDNGKIKRSWKKAIMLFDMCFNVLKYDFQEMLMLDVKKQIEWLEAKDRDVAPLKDPFPRFRVRYQEIII